MTSSPDLRRATILRLGAVLSVVAALLFVRLGGFGIWDPWELDAADAARALIDGTPQQEEIAEPPMTRWLVARSFAIFGVSEGSGRLPLALGGLAAALACALLLWRFASERAAAIGALVVASTPLLLFNARQMHGDAIAMASSAFVFYFAASLAFRTHASVKTLVAPAIGLVVAWTFAVYSAGALQGVVPPLAAVAGVAVVRGLPSGQPRRIGVGVVVGLGLAITLAVGSAIVADEAGYSALLGGTPEGGNPPTFEAALEVVFHGLAPWTALIFVAGLRLLAPHAVVPSDASEVDDATRARLDLRFALLFWAALGYAALTLHTARYGPSTYLPVVALAAAIAIFLDEVQESGRAWWPEAVIGVLLTGLVLRDFVLYPGSPMRGMPLDGLTVPDVFDRAHEPVVLRWAFVLGAFALMVGLVLGSGRPDDDARPSWRAPIAFVVDRWRSSWAAAAWLVLAGLVLVGTFGFGLTCWVMGDDLGLVSIVIRIGKKLVALPFVIAAVVWATPWVFYGMRRLGRFRLVPLLLAGVAVGGYSAFVFQPALSQHFSPREVYDTYNELRGEGDELAEYRVSGRAAAYYAEGETTDLSTQEELLTWLGEERRRWAVIPADELAAVNRAFRQRAERHLFVADARSARVLLVTNRPVEGRENENFIAGAVYSEADAPAPQHRVGGRFDERIELVGYDLELPQNGYVGAGQSFTVTWHWKALQRVPGSYKIFLHVDGAGNRLNGDHDPVEERYPVRLWDEGDVVLDRQTLTVPANYRPGSYTFFIGFYSGNDRLAVTPANLDDGEKRLRAGTLIVR